jgi:ribose 5-phosphate isomerase A
MIVGLGSGTTVNLLIAALRRRAPKAVFVGASPATGRAAQHAGLLVVPFDRRPAKLDLALDGADQVDDRMWLVKGGGAAHTREKILARAAGRFVVLVTADKRVSEVRPPIPLEIVVSSAASTLAALGDARPRPNTPISPDGGLIADYFDHFEDPWIVAQILDRTPGVVAHGLFEPSIVHQVLVSDACGVRAFGGSGVRH